MNPKTSRLAPLLLLLAGCGGTDHRSATAVIESPFLGTYTGSYQAPFLEDAGTFNLTVSSTGTITGTGNSNEAGSGTLTGTIGSTGTVAGRLAFDNGTTATLNGPVARQTNGSLTGTLTEVYAGHTGDVTVTLTPVNE